MSKKKEKSDKINNLPIFNINIFNKINYNISDNENPSNYSKVRKDSILEEELKKKDRLFTLDENNITIDSSVQKTNIRSYSISLANNPHLIFSNELFFDELDKIEGVEKTENDEINLNINNNIFSYIKVDNLEENYDKKEEEQVNEEKEESIQLKIKIKNPKKPETNIEENSKKIKKSFKMTGQKLIETDKIESKLSKTRRYWHKDNYFLIPNIFKLLTPFKKDKKNYIEHIDYCHKEILVQTNGEKVRDYISIIKKHKN